MSNIMAFHKTKLNKSEVEKIFFKFCVAVAEIKNPKEAALFVRDILSYQEAEMIAKRLMIAEMILENSTYDEITAKLKVSNGTIARVQAWLKISGEGYKRAIQLTKISDQKMPAEKYSEWNSIKRRYPTYYWPQLLLEELVKGAGQRQKKHISSVMREIERSKRKTALLRRISKLINYSRTGRA
jgi:TrpR-related protein YerC/YecD